ncbi:MAG: hypothetical protein RSF86_14200 [Angelakisella sp.]
MTSGAVVLMVCFASVGTGVAGTAVSRTMAGCAMVEMVCLAGVWASVADTAISRTMTGQAVRLMVRFAVVRAVGVALVSAS